MADDKSLSRYACDYCWKKKASGRRFQFRYITHIREISLIIPTAEQTGQQGGPNTGFAVLQSCSGFQTIQDQPPEFGNDTLSTITSAFSHTRDVLECNGIRQNLTDITGQGTGMLSHLYNQFKDSTYDYDKIKAAVRMKRREHEAFFIPTELVGEMFVQCFLTAVDRGYPIISRPPQEVLLDLVFRPSSVDNRGWLLMFNTVLATASTQSQQLSEYTFHLRWNAWVAADEASIFMEPTILNIQALTVFAVHGQDLVTPSLCWNLASQACRMAQMIKLPLPSVSETRNGELYSRNLCLFWSLFIIDKSLSLSFGCPPVLPSALYGNLELPSPQQLSAYRPHLTTSGAVSVLPPHVEFFGAFYFVQCTKLAMIMGDISDFYLLGRRDSSCHASLRKRLDQWISVVQQSQTLHTNLADAVDSASLSIKIGFSFLNYQYHHLIVCLTRGDESCREKCLGSARAAISLLKGLVAHSEEVFNGIVWQQLYYPFTPFFVLFGEVITNPTGKTTVEDLQLLRQTVLYFLEFQKYHTSAVKLEKVAETFTKIAEAYVRHIFRKQKGLTSSELFRTTKPVVFRAQPGSGPSNTFTSSITATSSSQQDVNPASSNVGTADHMDYQLRLDETSNLDPTSLLRLFSYQGNEASIFRDIHVTDIPADSMQGLQEREGVNSNNRALDHWQIPEPSQYVSLHDVEMNGRNQFSQCTFDWFALENYAM
ncbi:hypothetical protein AYL99_03204 [Fonsecaea erecta]|uniref:Xylanolytic transcriptional activator regulatory domain-containing protein n=1 Tax=Fonsecaea erecta TaxID=1367422 RepID=A0A178ZW70_9EURO|nr:hypothetical protein AYL99_03204 [Fonsecaea erecta]OAP63977.1 hypothetical protein AYL99_03204 [Fonsecaea erecta]